MPVSFLPKAIFGKLTDIMPDFLMQKGIRLLLLDFDNTMLPYTSAEPTDELLSWLEGMKQAGLSLCVVSNSRKDKSPTFCRLYELGCVTRSRKPFSRGIRRSMELFHALPSQTALVGDQIYTDVLGANGAGIFSILVKPIHLHTVWLRMRHVAEKPFIYLARKRRIHYDKS